MHSKLTRCRFVFAVVREPRVKCADQLGRVGLIVSCLIVNRPIVNRPILSGSIVNDERRQHTPGDIASRWPAEK
jgi:hypothetical protein